MQGYVSVALSVLNLCITKSMLSLFFFFLFPVVVREDAVKGKLGMKY